MKEITISDLISILVKKLYLILIVTVLGALLAFTYSKFMVTPVYNTSAYFSISNLDEESSSVSNPTASNIQASQLLAKAIGSALLVDGSDIYTLVAEELGGEINGRVSVSADETFVLRISVTSVDPDDAREIAFAFRKCIPDYLKNHNLGSAAPLNTPVEPEISNASTVKNVVLGAFISAVVTAGIVIVLAMFDNSVKDEEEVTARFGVPVLSEIPSLIVKDKKEELLSKIPFLRKKARKNVKTTGSEDIIKPSTSFNVIESYKQLRTNLTFAVSVSKKKIITITSSLPGEGKSTTACNLAISMAEDNKKVIIIDCDLRKPTIHKKLKLDNRCGLSGYLSGQYSLEDALKTEVYKNLDILTSGALPPNPSELLGSEMFEKLLSELSGVYDYIIIDSPPVNIVTDTRSFAAKTAGVLLVARQNFTLYSDIVKSENNIKLANANILGVVITDVNVKEKRYGGKYRYEYKYKYASDESEQNYDIKSKVDLSDDD